MAEDHAEDQAPLRCGSVAPQQRPRLVNKYQRNRVSTYAAASRLRLLCARVRAVRHRIACGEHVSERSRYKYDTCSDLVRDES